MEAAKQLYKEARGVETEALLVDAYAARIRALIATGMSREARELASLVVDRYPGTRERIAPLVRESAARVEGDLGPLLALRASADSATRREAEITLRRVIVDPRALADHPALPEDDPLRQAARVVSELFSAVRRAAPRGAWAPRRDLAPLAAAPWKMLVRAIDAYYRATMAPVLRNLPRFRRTRAGAALTVLGDWGNALHSTPSMGARAPRKVSAGRAASGGLVELGRRLGARTAAAGAVRARSPRSSRMPATFRATFAGRSFAGNALDLIAALCRLQRGGFRRRELVS